MALTPQHEQLVWVVRAAAGVQRMRCGNGIHRIPYTYTYRKVSLTATSGKKKTA